MLDLSPETEALARRLAETQHVSVDEAVRRALEARERSAARGETSPSKDMSPEAIAARKAASDRIVTEIAKLPILDPRPVQEIIDDLNAI